MLKTLVRNIRRTLDPFYLVHIIQIWRQPAVHADDLLVDDRRDGQAVEAVREGFPELDRVAALALVVEAVDAVDARALVVAAQQKEILCVFDFVTEQQNDSFNRMLAAIDVVAQK